MKNKSSINNHMSKKVHKNAKNTRETMNIKIPRYFSVFASDYHFFENFKEDIRDYLNISFKYEEIGCCGAQYEAVFWIGQKPHKHIKKVKAVHAEYTNF